jgi:hypothetical protein
MAITPEGRVKAHVKALLNKYNAYYFMPATGGYGRSGIPDIIGCIGGQFFAIECKAKRGELTALQARELDRIANECGVIFVANEHNLEMLEDLIKGMRLTSSQGEV